MSLEFEVYQQRAALLSRRKEWRWRLIHRNGNIMADSSEGYVNRVDCIQAIETIRRQVRGALVGFGDK